MSRGEVLAALAANFLVAGMVSYLKGPNVGLICLAAGFILLIASYFFRRKPAEPPASKPITVHQESKQEFAPQFKPQFNPSIQIGIADSKDASVERIKLRHEEVVLQALKRSRQADRILPVLFATLVAVIRDAHPQMTKLEIADALERLHAKELVERSPIDAPGGYVYRLSDFAE